MIDTSTVTTELMTVEDKQELETASDNRIAELKKNPEVQKLNSEIKFNDISTVNEFGKKPALELSKTADALLAITRDVSKKETLEMFEPLAKVLTNFKIDEFKGETPSQSKNPIINFFGKTKKKIEITLDDMFKKYTTMGNELNDVVQTLNKYKVDIVKANGMIQQLQEANTKHFTELEKYIAAGELAEEEAKELLENFKNDNTLNEFEKADRIERAQLLIDQINKKVHEFRIVQQVSLQSIPMLNIMRRNNFELANQVDSKLITTIPIFKTMMVEAVIQRRQAIQAKSTAKIDEVTEKALRMNAENAAMLSTMMAKREGTGITLETLQYTYETIKNGVTETERIFEENRNKRAQDTIALEGMKKELIETNFFKKLK